MAAVQSSKRTMAPLQAREMLFIDPQSQGRLKSCLKISSFLAHPPTNPVYPGMVISESSKYQDFALLSMHVQPGCHGAKELHMQSCDHYV